MFLKSKLQGLFRVGLIALPLFATACGGEDVGTDEGNFAELSADPNRFIDPPFYFTVPHSGFLDADVAAIASDLGRPYVGVTVPGFEDSPVGQRVLAYQGVHAPQARRDASEELAGAGLLQDGDIILSYRPSWEATLPYSHIQMGMSHAGLIYVQDGKAFNIDMPLDNSYSGPGLTSQLDAEHYGEHTDAFHIVRPRNFDQDKKDNLQSWIEVVKANAGAIRNTGNLMFNSDYLAPYYARTGKSVRASITRFGKVLLEQDLVDNEMKMYCSEFAWHMLSLAACTPQEILDETEAEADCIEEIYEPMSMLATGGNAGLAEGPLMLINAMSDDVGTKMSLIEELFAEGDARNLSSGHRRVAEQIQPAISQLSGYYQARAAGQEVDASEIQSPVTQVPPNFSPTGFLLNSFIEPGTDSRSFDYVVTLEFTNEEGIRRAESVGGDDLPADNR